MTEKPFLHKKAFTDLKTNFMFHDELSKNLLKLIMGELKPDKGEINFDSDNTCEKLRIKNGQTKYV